IRDRNVTGVQTCALPIVPDYTSRIVNVGIQQKGVEDGVPDTIRKESMEKVLLFAEEADADTIENAYALDGDLYTLKKEITSQEQIGRASCRERVEDRTRA